MKHQDSLIPNETVVHGAGLPRLSEIAELPLSEREDALASWVSWFNGNRERMDERTEQQLDEALHRLECDGLAEERLARVQENFDQWLDSAGRPGQGRGPDERLD